MLALQGHHVDIVRLQEIGEHFCDALACLHGQLYWRRGVMACSPGPLRLLHYTCTYTYPMTAELRYSFSDSSYWKQNILFQGHNNYLSELDKSI